MELNELKEKVRTLCLQEDPSNALILLTLEELAKTARRGNHEEAEVFEELARQANRYQTKLDISNLCLQVLGGKAADAISKAITKCLKEKPESKPESKMSNVDEQRRPESPLSNLYPYQPPMMYPFMSGGYPHNGQNFGGYGQSYRGGRGSYRGSFRPKGPCHFCDSNTHLVKDCEKMKAAKANNFSK